MALSMQKFLHLEPGQAVKWPNPWRRWWWLWLWWL